MCLWGGDIYYRPERGEGVRHAEIWGELSKEGPAGAEAGGGNMSKVFEEQQEGECRGQRSGPWGLRDHCKGSELLIST